MSRDEARHAGFINDALREAGVAVNLGFLTKAKKYTYFRPKFIYYATYLSREDRLRPLHHHLPPPRGAPRAAVPPDLQVVPEWCNDEFSHGEAFALLMKTDPKLTTSFANKLWIKFFLTAVYSTMWVRDHARPEFHKALGVDIDWYDQEVFRKTSTIARQVFPIELDIDHPRWIPGLKRMNSAFVAMDAAKRQGRHRRQDRKTGQPARARRRPSSALYTIPVKTPRPARECAAGAVLLID